MSEAIDDDLYERTRALLEPGEVALNGAIVHLDTDEDIEMQEATLEVGEMIAERAGAAGDWYVYSGNDDPDFSSNQHQGRTLEDDEFVWECQQLLRDGSFDLVFYYRAELDHGGLLDDLADAGYDVTGVEVG